MSSILNRLASQCAQIPGPSHAPKITRTFCAPMKGPNPPVQNERRHGRTPEEDARQIAEIIFSQIFHTNSRYMDPRLYIKRKTDDFPRMKKLVESEMQRGDVRTGRNGVINFSLDTSKHEVKPPDPDLNLDQMQRHLLASLQQRHRMLAHSVTNAQFPSWEVVQRSLLDHPDCIDSVLWLHRTFGEPCVCPVDNGRPGIIRIADLARIMPGSDRSFIPYDRQHARTLGEAEYPNVMDLNAEHGVRLLGKREYMDLFDQLDPLRNKYDYAEVRWRQDIKHRMVYLDSDEVRYNGTIYTGSASHPRTGMIGDSWGVLASRCVVDVPLS